MHPDIPWIALYNARGARVPSLSKRHNDVERIIMITRRTRTLSIGLLLAGVLAVPTTAYAVGDPSPAASAAQATATSLAATSVAPSYENPLDLHLPDGEAVVSCADPSIIRGQQEGDTNWYLYCTTDPLTETERDAEGNLVFHYVPIFTSTDLVDWTYAGDAFEEKPAWIGNGTFWAPEITYQDGQYVLYYATPETAGGSSAIGVGTSDSPTGPFTDSGDAVVDPAANGRWQFDPEFLFHEGEKYLYFGSYFGGINIRQLDAEGFESDPATEQPITIDNRYEGPEIYERDGWFYLFVSATNCCAGPQTGYAVFVGRSLSPFGPFVDQQGVSLLDSEVGGTPVIYQNGNRWIGTGHNTVFTDYDGQTWTIYHAVDRFDPYFEGAVGFTKRPALLDAIDWVDGWPVLRGGQGPSDEPMPGPAAQPGQETAYEPDFIAELEIGRRYADLSDQFGGKTLDDQWTWVREPDPATWEIAHGTLTWQTQAADLHPEDPNMPLASVLTEPAPEGDYLVETRVSVNVPPDVCCQNYVQGGILIYGDDGNYLKLVEVSIWNTRQTEFGKEVTPVPEGYPHYGNTVVGPVGAEWTWLRIVVDEREGEEDIFTPYTSIDGENWDRGGAWTHELGDDERIGLVSMGGSGFETEFDYLRVSEVLDPATIE